jgi:SAM-dependent methyltransferase
MTAKTLISKTVNSGLQPFGVRITRTRPTNPAVRGFIPARKTLDAARRSGLPLADYIDQTFAEPGETAATVKAMLDLSGLHGQVSRVCEIGTGSGRYMQKIIESVHPQVYEVYETAEDWLRYLRTLNVALIQPCDGRTLSSTATASVDLVHAQKVFVYLDFWTTARYLDEMVRVVRPGGAVAFDVVTENCLDEAPVRHWMENGCPYKLTPRSWVMDFLGRRGLSYVGNYFPVLPPGICELMVFRSGDSGGPAEM